MGEHITFGECMVLFCFGLLLFLLDARSWDEDEKYLRKERKRERKEKRLRLLSQENELQRPFEPTGEDNSSS